MKKTSKLTQKPRVTALICTLNEEGNLPHVLPKIPSIVDEVLLVDGHSSDGTIEVAKKLYPNIRIMLQPGKGKGDALRYGLQQATGDIIVTLDADGQTDPSEIPLFVQAILQGYDFAKGTRFRRPFSRVRPFHRILGNWLITLCFDGLFFCRYTDLCSGYNAFLAESISLVDLSSSDGFADEPLLHSRVRKKKLRVVEVPYPDMPRISGVSKAPSWGQGFRAIRTVIRERFSG